MEERRRHARSNIPVGISYHILKALSSASVNTKNISLGGVCVPTVVQCTPHVMVELKMYFKTSSTPVSVIGEIIWVKENPENRMMFNVGVKFVALSEEEKRLISGILAESKASRK